MNSVLVIARATADSDELLEAMVSEAARAPARFLIVVPRCSGDPRGAVEVGSGLERASARASAAGLDVRGQFGDSDPVIAAVESFDPWQVDKIIVSTLPTRVSRWCAMDVPARLRRLTRAPVMHVEAREPNQALQLSAIAS